MSLGSRLKDSRRGLGLTQQQMASKLGTSSGYISEIEAGKKTPGSDLLSSLKREFDIDINWLLTGEGPRGRGGHESKEETAGLPIYDADQMKEAIMAAEEYLHEIKKDLAPKDKAELITKLYQIAMESADEESPEAARRKASRMALELARYTA